ncbi:OmpH family outer membrane protein [uncultured Amaricoccus sp.]|uniref:OmpH family outer membrane protein n=2 Tax=Amaricoccus TaxID=56999 RepID=UPI00261F7EF0|nr:OmpH family outer membrane protein [uncultured Amaricoccus sp.]
MSRRINRPERTGRGGVRSPAAGRPGLLAAALVGALALATAAPAQDGPPAQRPAPESPAPGSLVPESPGFASDAPAATSGAPEQPASTFLFLNQERILTDSETGRKLLDEEEAARDALRGDARAIDAAFEDEEQRLTELRKTLSSEEFRARADDFDARVVKARQDQDARSSSLAQDLDRRRRAFYSSVAPILVKLLGRYHAYAIFDESSVLLADDSLNITGAVIAEIDAQPPAAVPVPPATLDTVPAPLPAPGRAAPAEGDQ